MKKKAPTLSFKFDLKLAMDALTRPTDKIKLPEQSGLSLKKEAKKWNKLA